MKKILLIILMMLSLHADAQIQRRFFGFTLGVANKQQITYHFKKQNKTVSNDNGVLVVKNLKFGGQFWDEVRFAFYKNRFYEIFLVSSTRYNSKDLLDDRWDYLLNSFFEKYRNYYYPDSEEYTRYFLDDKTVLRFHYENSHGIWYQDLVYYDDKLFDASSKSDNDDL